MPLMLAQKYFKIRFEIIRYAAYRNTKMASAEKCHPKPHGLKKQSNKNSFIIENSN
jgi:hypothetical protein